MPRINIYKCNKCELTLPHGWGGHTYVKDDDGNKIVCQHPEESVTVAKVLGIDFSDVTCFPWLPPDEKVQKLISERTGFNSHCICLKCLNQFDLDVKKEERICPECKSNLIKTETELVGEQCPKCKSGTVEEKWGGIIT